MLLNSPAQPCGCTCQHCTLAPPHPPRVLTGVSAPGGAWQFMNVYMRNLAGTASRGGAALLPRQAPVLVKSDGTKVQLDASEVQRRLGALAGACAGAGAGVGVDVLADSPAVDTSGLSKLSEVAELSPLTPIPTPSRHVSLTLDGLSSADAQAIAALQALGSSCSSARRGPGDASFSPLPIGGRSPHHRFPLILNPKP